jgi:hypothetical protein
VTKPPTIAAQPLLARLISACDVDCGADCCGLDAFDFSPLHVAVFLSRMSGRIETREATELHGQLDALLDETRTLAPNELGHVCHIEGTNQYLTADGVATLVEEIRTAIRHAPDVLELSNRLRAKPTRWNA